MMDVGRCFNEALDVYKKNLAQLVVGAFLFQLLSLLSLTILIGPLSGGWSLMTINALRRADRYVDLGDMFGAFDRFVPLAGLFYVTLIPILLSSVLCFASAREHLASLANALTLRVACEPQVLSAQSF